jgi:hypothetical protein
MLEALASTEEIDAEDAEASMVVDMDADVDVDVIANW